LIGRTAIALVFAATLILLMLMDVGWNLRACA
jgi:hypothetical protein